MKIFIAIIIMLVLVFGVVFLYNNNLENNNINFENQLQQTNQNLEEENMENIKIKLSIKVIPI